MKKAVITTTTFGKYDDRPLVLLKKHGFEVILNPYGRTLKKDEAVELCKGAVGIVAGTETLDADVIGKLTNLRVISRCGSGLTNVDLDTAERLGIKVFNTPDGPVLAVAELTVGLILGLLRKICRMDRVLREGSWDKMMGNLLYGRKVGIKGFGRIGRKVAELLRGFGCEVAYADPFVEDGVLGLKLLSFEELLSWGDVISIHVSAKDRLIGRNEFQMMKKGTWLVNTSRGGVVDETVLYEYLSSGYLSGAALDVFEEEPYVGPLNELDNVILTAHIGSYAKEARVDMEMQTVINMLTGLGVIE